MLNTVYVDPSAQAGGNGSLSHPFNSWNSVVFSPGVTYLQKAGTTYTGMLIVQATGTGNNEIQIGSYGTGPQPVIDGLVDFDGASYVSMQNLAVTGSPFAAVTIQDGANHIEVANDTLSSSTDGIWLGNGAGSGDTIEDNTITGNTYDGIGIDEVNNPANSETVIADNSITNNGAHGIELQGNYFLVGGNTVQNNGLLVSGASGIHVYASGSTDNEGEYNTIVQNVVTGTHDATGQDGNGIELDQFTRNNTVSGNLTTQNDGAGIVLYDSSQNTVSGNTLSGNSVDPGHTHVMPGDLVINASLGLSYGNTISGNIFLQANDIHPSINVDAVSAVDNNVFTSNVFENTSGLSISELNGMLPISQPFLEAMVGNVLTSQTRAAWAAVPAGLPTLIVSRSLPVLFQKSGS